MYFYLFLLFGATLFFIFAVFISNYRNKIKVNIEVVDKYKDIAYRLIKDNSKLDEERKKYRTRKLISTIFIVSFFSLFFLASRIDFRLYFVFLIALIIYVLYLILCNRKTSFYDEIISNIIHEYKSDLNYDHYQGINSSIYREARFEGYDRYHSEDLMEGTINGQDFVMSEVHTERRHTDDDGHTSYTTIFHGAFAKVSLKKDFKCFVNICNNKIKLFNKDTYTTIDNEAFEKIYDVFTDDKIKAMRLLTPDVTSNIIDLYNETGIYCEVKIINNILYIRLYTGALFTFSFSNPEKEAELVGRSLAIIDSVFRIMENFIGEIERFDI